MWSCGSRFRPESGSCSNESCSNQNLYKKALVRMKFFELKRGKNTPPHFSVQKSSCSNPEKTPSLFSCTKTQLFEFRVGAFREKIPLLSSCAKRPMFENTVSYPHQLTVQALGHSSQEGAVLSLAFLLSGLSLPLIHDTLEGCSCYSTATEAN